MDQPSHKDFLRRLQTNLDGLKSRKQLRSLEIVSQSNFCSNDYLGLSTDPRLRDKFLSGIPAGRLGQPDDIQGLAVFLASDASRWITGALIPMDGGNLAMNAGGSVGPGNTGNT